MVELQYSGRASPCTYGGGGCVGEGEGGANDQGSGCPLPSSLYIRVPRGAPALGDPIPLGGGARGGFPPPPPKAPRRCLPLVGLLPIETLGAWAPWGWFPLA